MFLLDNTSGNHCHQYRNKKLIETFSGWHKQFRSTLEDRIKWRKNETYVTSLYWDVPGTMQKKSQYRLNTSDLARYRVGWGMISEKSFDMEMEDGAGAI